MNKQKYLSKSLCVPSGLGSKLLVVSSVLSLLSLVACEDTDPNIFKNNAETILSGKAVTFSGACALDSVAKNGATESRFKAKAGGDALFSGWAWDKEKKLPSDFVAIRLTNALDGLPNYAYTSERAARADVAEYLKISADSKVSFELNSKILPAKAGIYRIELLQVWAEEISICNVSFLLHLN